MHFLLVNDDGFDSPELRMLCDAAVKRGHRVTIAAPETQQSGKSHSFTVLHPILAQEEEIPGAARAWRIAGTPVDCARIGMMALADEPVDLVISGINQGYNIGLATYVSGTVGAAREAAFSRADGRALAVSMEPQTPEDMRRFLADYAILTAEKLVKADVPAQSVCNLNAPCCALRELRGVKVCPISRITYTDGYERYNGPRGQVSFWLQPMAQEYKCEEGTDFALLNENWMTITFLTPEPISQEEYADFPVPIPTGIQFS